MNFRERIMKAGRKQAYGDRMHIFTTACTAGLTLGDHSGRACSARFSATKAMQNHRQTGGDEKFHAEMLSAQSTIPCMHFQHPSACIA